MPTKATGPNPAIYPWMEGGDGLTNDGHNYTRMAEIGSGEITTFINSNMGQGFIESHDS